MLKLPENIHTVGRSELEKIILAFAKENKRFRSIVEQDVCLACKDKKKCKKDTYLCATQKALGEHDAKYIAFARGEKINGEPI